MKSTQLLFLLFISVAAWAGGPAKSNFTAMEVNHIRVKTPGLFNGRKSFSIHLDSIKENEYCFPLPGGKVISAYGARRGHSGTDIKTKANDTIRCAFDGIVRMAKTYAAYGNVVVVRHDNGLESIGFTKKLLNQSLNQKLCMLFHHALATWSGARVTLLKNRKTLYQQDFSQNLHVR